MLSHAVGWPAVAAAATAAPWIGTGNAAICGSVTYGLSWLMAGAAAVLGGPDLARFAKEQARALWVRFRG